MSKLIKIAIETARDLKVELITLREIEALNLPKVEQLSPKKIKAIRKKDHLSQCVMARYLNVSPSTYQKWERGEVVPHGGNLKLLNLAYRGGVRSIA